VFRAVRLCGGVVSAPLTVKVFPDRPDPPARRRAALLGQGRRGADGSEQPGGYRASAGAPTASTGRRRTSRGRRPSRVTRCRTRSTTTCTGEPAGVPPAAGRRAGSGWPARRSGHPAERGGRAAYPRRGCCACCTTRPRRAPPPYLHMDVKPSNVMVLATGEVRLIDFIPAPGTTAARRSPRSRTPRRPAGPEALHGSVGPAYDVHGFGAVAFYLVTGALPRGREVPPPGTHPLISGRPALRDHLARPALAERPGDRPSTLELTAGRSTWGSWVRAAGVTDEIVDWGGRAGHPGPCGRPGLRGVGYRDQRLPAHRAAGAGAGPAAPGAGRRAEPSRTRRYPVGACWPPPSTPRTPRRRARVPPHRPLPDRVSRLARRRR